MRIEVRTPDGEMLFTQDELERALARQTAHRVLPEWMHTLIWPQGMVRAMRQARRDSDCRVLRGILFEARMLSDAERAGLLTAAAAIRYRLQQKYRRTRAPTPDSMELGPDPMVNAGAIG